MRCWQAVLVLSLVCAMVSRGHAQQNGPTVDELRRQVEMLQRQIERLEESGTDKPRVTQLSTSHRPVERVEQEPEMVVRIYDLSDLFTLAPPYAAMFGGELTDVRQPVFASEASPMTGGGMGGMGMFSLPVSTPTAPLIPNHVLPQMFAGGSVPSARTSMDELIDAITGTIAPQQWDEVGGSASISRLGTTLLISADPQMHQQIESLLDSFRQRWATLRTISIDAEWRWLTVAQLRSLLAKAPQAGRDAAFGLVDQTAWGKLDEKAPVATDPQRAGYHAVVTCYNGQTVHAVSGLASQIVAGLAPRRVGAGLVVSDHSPKEGKEPKAQAVETGQMVYEPILYTLQEGAVLQVTPISSVSGKYVAVDVHSRVVLARQEPKPTMAVPVKPAAEMAPQDAVALLDRPQIVRQHLETTVRLPVDQRMLVGGMTFESQPKPGEPNLYLFLTASVQELRDDVARRDPEAQPDAKVSASPARDPIPASAPRPSAKSSKKAPPSSM